MATATLRRQVLLLASLLLLGATWRFFDAVAGFVTSSLQMDFSAFYSAGQAVNAGLSPYENHLLLDTRLWDGVDAYRHSRFLYPPIVAQLMRPLASLPYETAKTLWTLVSIASGVGSLAIVVKFFPLDAVRLILVGTFSLLFFPLLAHLERGQVDLLCLLALETSFLLFVSQRKARQLFGGLVLAMAVVLKLHVALALPFLALQRRTTAVAAAIAGFIALMSIPMLLPGGYETTLNYATVQLPRISRWGELGPPESKLLVDGAELDTTALKSGRVVRDGVVYDAERLHFGGNATLVRPLQRILGRSGIALPSTLVSLLLCFAALAFTLVWTRRGNLGSPRSSPRAEAIYWHFVLLVVVLIAPLTWTMNLVWLLPVPLICTHELARTRGIRDLPPFLLTLLGLLLVAFPDQPVRWDVAALIQVPWRYKNLVATTLVALCLAWYLGRFSGIESQ